MSIGTFREWLREQEINEDFNLSTAKNLKDIKGILDDERWFEVIKTELKDNELFIVVDKKYITQKIADKIQRHSGTNIKVRTIQPKKVGDPTIVVSL
jgi:hypothetical protein